MGNMGNKHHHHKGGEEASLQFKQTGKESKSKCDTEPKRNQTYHLPVKGPELNESDFSFLADNTGKSEEVLKEIFARYNLNKENPQLSRENFFLIYQELDPDVRKDEINEYANQAYSIFDPENSGNLLLNEFLVTYALTTRKTEMRRKFEYSFELYDISNSGSLKMDEVKSVLNCICDLLGIKNKQKNQLEIIEFAIREIQFDGEEKVNKEEFINGLMKNQDIREILQPYSKE